MEKLQAIDRNFLLLDSPISSQAIAEISVVEGLPDLGVVGQRLKFLVELVPRLSLNSSAPSFASENSECFSLDKHFTIKELEVGTSKAGMTEFLALEFSRPFPKSQPAWSLTCITSQTSLNRNLPVCCMIMFKIHHSLADGLSLIEINKFLSGVSRESSLKVESAITNRFKRAQSKKFSPHSAWKLVSYFKRLRRNVFGARGKSPLNGSNSGDRRILVFDLPYENFSNIKRTLACSINDVVLATVAGAVKKYHSKHGVVSEEIDVFVPVSMRQMSDNRRVGNFISLLKIALPLGKESSLECLKLISKKTEAMKERGEEGTYHLVNRLLAAAPRWFGAYMVVQLVKKANFICTNVPKSKKTLFLAGAKIQQSYGVPALLPENGIAFSFVSYTNKYCVSIVSDPSVVKDPEILVQGIIESLGDLQTNPLQSS